MKRNLIIFIISFSLISFSTTYAQDTITHKSVNELFQLSLYDFLNVVITPSKLPQSAGSVTQKIDVIIEKEIETSISGNRNVCEAISKLPGASVTVLSRNDANWGTYGGIGPKYSTYMLQGLPVDAFVDPMSLDLNAIDRIEVQRGPASVIYPNYMSQDFAGTQSPLAGTVNLILKEKVEQAKTSIKTSYGSYNTLNGQIFHQNRTERLSYFLGSTYEMSDYINYGINGSWLNMKKNPEYKKTKVYGGFTFFPDKTEKQKFTVFFQKTWHEGDAGRVYRGYDNQYATINVGYDIAFSDKAHLQSHLGIRSYDRLWQESNFGLIDTLKSDNGVEQVIIPFDISLSLRHGKSNSLSLGTDYQGAKYSTWADPLTGYPIYVNKSAATQVGVYIQEEWRPGSKLLIRFGVRYAYIKNLITLVNSGAPGDNSVSWAKFLWSTGTRYTVSEKVSLYANGGNSFTPPGLKSSGGTIPLRDKGISGHNGQLPNPDLKPESGIGADAGIDFKLPKYIKIGVRCFYIYLKDAIIDNIVSLNPSQTQSINAGSSTSQGGEMEVSQRVNKTFSWFVNGTYMNTNIRNDRDANQNNVNIPFSPNCIVNVGGSVYSSSGFKFTPSLNYNGGFYDGTSKIERRWFTPGIVFNACISQKITKSDSQLVECFAQLYNITNNDYNMPWQFKNPGFSAMYGIKVTF